MIRKKWAVLLLLLAILVSILIFTFRLKNEMVDFQVNYLAGKRIRAGETLYRAEDGHYQFKYPPFSSFLYIPLSLLPLSAAKAVWFSIILVSSFFIFSISFRLVPDESWLSPWLKVVPPLVLARYFLRELQLGQINALMTLLLLLIARQLAKNRMPRTRVSEAGGGLLLGLATALKPYALIYFPYLMIKKLWRGLASASLFVGLAFVLPAAFYGWGGNLKVHGEWLGSFSHSTARLLATQDNISLIGFLTKWSRGESTAAWLYLVLLFLAAVAFYFVFAKGREIVDSPVLDCSLLLLAIPLLSPLGWDYTLLSSAPALVLVLNSARHYSKFWRVVLGVDLFIITFSLFDFMGRRVYTLFMSWSVITLCFLVLAGYVVYLRIKNLR